MIEKGANERLSHEHEEIQVIFYKFMDLPTSSILNNNNNNNNHNNEYSF
jgi:hypothetical protein